ncbi:MAG: hypothetical protein QGG88_12225 [Gammaproteobacteria bacterium]|nr:hypothetical protein [Gammaproteobacteria bacterium]
MVKRYDSVTAWQTNSLLARKVYVSGSTIKWHKEKGGIFVIHKALIAAHSGGYGQNEQRSEVRK